VGNTCANEERAPRHHAWGALSRLAGEAFDKDNASGARLPTYLYHSSGGVEVLSSACVVLRRVQQSVKKFLMLRRKPRVWVSEFRVVSG